jgi:CheY-like chemotaxis protein
VDAAATRQLLVVDDDEQIRQLVRWTAEDAGFEVIEVRDGQTALDILQASAQPLVVVLDINLPELSGKEVLRAQIEAGSSMLQHHYVLMTGSIELVPALLESLLCESAPESLALVPLAKPFGLDELADAIERSARRHMPGPEHHAQRQVPPNGIA